MKKYITIILGLVTTLMLSAQDRTSYFDINAGGGLQKLKYSLDDGNVKVRPGITFNLDYSYFLNPVWGIGLGVGLQSTQAKGTLNFMTGDAAVDEDGDNYEFRTYYENWTETQKALFLDIPVGMQYQHQINDKYGLVAFAGVKASIPVSSSYNVVSGSITTTGYYGQWNVELRDMPQHGFTTLSDRPSGKLDLKTSFSLFADLECLYKMSGTFDLFAGGYISYGLNNLVDGGNNAIYQQDGTYNSMLTSTQTDKVKLVVIGVKAGIRFHINRHKKIAISVIPVEPVVPVIKEEPVLSSEEKVEGQNQVNIGPVDSVKPQAETILIVKDTIIKTQAIANQINLKFPLDSDVPLNDAFDSTFVELARMLIANPTLKVRIVGHTCNLASREYNLKVGMERAEVGKAKLIKFGVPASQIITESKAFDDPLVPNINEENRALNRRIALIIE